MGPSDFCVSFAGFRSIRMPGTKRLLLLLGLCVAVWLRAAATQPPNIIVILSDDMGYSDLGCYGGEIATPNLDALAAGGLRFTQFYNTARCCPTRASLLTGLYPHQAGVGYMTDRAEYSAKAMINEWYAGDLRPDTATLGEAMRANGYRTYAIGKWHVTKNIEDGGARDNSRVARRRVEVRVERRRRPMGALQRRAGSHGNERRRQQRIRAREGNGRHVESLGRAHARGAVAVEAGVE